MDDWILEGLQIQIDKEEVFKMIDCYEDSPVYEEVAEEYDEILEDMRALLKPIGIIGLGEITENIATEKYPAGTRTIFAVLSVGNEIKEESTKYFHEGDYVRGMLIDAIADTALFSLDDAMMDTLQKFCRKHKVGIRKRLEAPHDISMEAIKNRPAGQRPNGKQIDVIKISDNSEVQNFDYAMIKKTKKEDDQTYF